MRNTILFILGLVLATWFLLTSWVWFYFWAVIFSYPFGILALIFWFLIREDKKKRNIVLLLLLGLGLLSSLTALTYLLITH